MNNLIQKLATSTATVTLSLVVLSSVRAQAVPTYFFSQTLANDGILSGAFSGTDSNINGQIDANEFTAFTSEFQSTIPGFTNLTWGLANLSPLSYFTSPDDYSFTVTAPGPFPSGTGWNSSSLGLATYVGYASDAEGPISSVDSQTDTLQFTPVPENITAVPEPSSIGVGSAVVLGIGCLILKRKQKQ